MTSQMQTILYICQITIRRAKENACHAFAYIPKWCSVAIHQKTFRENSLLTQYMRVYFSLAAVNINSHKCTVNVFLLISSNLIMTAVLLSHVSELFYFSNKHF